MKYKNIIKINLNFNGVYSRKSLSKIKDGAYKMNYDEYESIRNQWIALYVNAKNVTYFDSLRVEHIPKEVIKFIGNKNCITNIYRIQAYDSIMCGYFCIGFIDFMLKGKSLLEYTNLFFPNEYKKNDKIILKYFQWHLKKLKYIAMFARNTENLYENEKRKIENINNS